MKRLPEHTCYSKDLKDYASSILWGEILKFGEPWPAFSTNVLNRFICEKFVWWKKEPKHYVKIKFMKPTTSKDQLGMSSWWDFSDQSSYATITSRFNPLLRQIFISKTNEEGWNNIAGSIVEHAASLEATTTSHKLWKSWPFQEIPQDKAIMEGLKCLGLALEMLTAVQAVFQKVKPSASKDSRWWNYKVVCEELPDTKSRLESFLSHLENVVMNSASPTSPEVVLKVFYGTMILFLIRGTLQKIWRYNKLGFRPFEDQARQDESFDKGSHCQVYQSMLLKLEASRSLFRSMLQAPDSTLAVGSGLYEEYQQAATLIPMTATNDASLKQYAAYFIDHSILSPDE